MANNVKIERLNHAFQEEISMILMTEIKDEDIKDFEVELGTKVFKCVKNFNDRSERVLTVDELLVSLGFSKQNVETNSDVGKKKFSFFRK